MSSKSSILSNIFKYSKFKQSGSIHFCTNDWRSILEKRNFFTKGQSNVLLASYGCDMIPTKAKNHMCLKIACNMSSTTNKGSGKNIEVADTGKKSVAISKKSFKRKFKHKNCKRCKANTAGETSREIVKFEATSSMKNHTNSLFKTVYVEFMESETFKGFGLTKGPSLPFNFNNCNRNLMHTNIELRNSPNGYLDAKVSNVRQIGRNKAINSLETNFLKRSDRHKDMQQGPTKDLKQVFSDKATVTNSKLTSGSGGHGGSSGGDGDDKKVFEEEVSSIKARRRKLWRTLSFTLLAFVLGLTTYVISKIGVIDMLELMRNAKSIDEPLPINSWSTFYGTGLKTEQLELSESKSEDNETDAVYITDIESPFEHINIPEFPH